MSKIQILLVEDNDGDIFLVSEALEEAKITNELHVIKNGQEAIYFLEKKKDYASVPKPDLIILDINLPKKNGHEVLKHIKTTAQLKHIPVIMLTTSTSSKDVLEAYQNHVNCYISKPVGGSDFMEVIGKIEDFWFSLVKLPSTV